MVTNADFATFDVTLASNHKLDKDVYLGAENKLLLRREPYLSDPKTPDLVKNVGSRCRNFMIKMCQEIGKRYDFNDPLFEMISLFGPDDILKPKSRDLLLTTITC